MGLFDRVKNLFTEPEEPEEEEIKVEQIKKEVKRKPTESRIVEHKHDKVSNDLEENSEEEKKVVEEEVTLTREKIKTPIFFTENDFADLEQERPKKVERKKPVETKATIKREEKKQPYSGSYTSTSILTKEKPMFKPTPIISPIYGILDKNYTKDDIVEKKDTRSIKSSDTVATTDRFDEVRTKAYGTLENELESTIYSGGKNDKKKNKAKIEDIDLFDELEQSEVKKPSLEDTAKLATTVNEQEKNIRELEEITMDLTKELDNLLLKKETYNQKKADIVHDPIGEEDDEPITESELFNLIDSMYEEGKE